MQRQRETEEELANSKAHREKVQKQKEREEQERVEQVTIYAMNKSSKGRLNWLMDSSNDSVEKKCSKQLWD